MQVALFKQVVDDLHSRGIRVIVDGVFNHTGRRFFAFQDLLDKGADSPYADW
jgi:cyclomaltodextrinase